jgi:hypothetical protein
MNEGPRKSMVPIGLLATNSFYEERQDAGGTNGVMRDGSERLVDVAMLPN